MENKAQREEVEKWITLLRSSLAIERLKGAQELASLGVRTRALGAVRTRGAISQAAPSRVPKGVDLSAAFEAFQKDQPTEIRREVAFVLGEWADETVVNLLQGIAEADSDAMVRGEAVDALGKIGGSEAVQSLKVVAHKDRSDNVRIRAVRALAKLTQTEPPGSSAIAEILQVLETVQVEDPSGSVRIEATRALACMRGQS